MTKRSTLLLRKRIQRLRNQYGKQEFDAAYRKVKAIFDRPKKNKE
jgi:hypothetical protein